MSSKEIFENAEKVAEFARSLGFDANVRLTDDEGLYYDNYEGIGPNYEVGQEVWFFVAIPLLFSLRAEIAINKDGEKRPRFTKSL
jgi:hypothetical protein